MRNRRGLIAAVMVAVTGAAIVVYAWASTSPAARERMVERVMRREARLGVSTAGLGPQGDLDAVVAQIAISAPGHPISPYIYGVAGADPATLRALGATVNRWGGNPSSRFNWTLGYAWNAGRDWEFRNVNYGGSRASQSDLFVSEALAAGVTPLMTVPTIGWVAKDDDTANRSLDVPARGGPAVSPAGAIAGYDPAANRARTSVPSFASRAEASAAGAGAGAVYQDEWVRHLIGSFGARSIRYLAIDNEPDLWSATHTDVHPAEMSYDAMLANFLDYARAVKAQDPGALVLGPVVSGWTGYFYSALDRGTDNFATHADRHAHGEKAFLPWWLAQVARADRTRGARSLDLLDVHYYPQAAGVTSTRSDPETQALRIRSTRSLFDPAYSDESWIGEPVALIPRLKAWIDQNYPGTGLSLSEYSWGGANDPSGAVAEAEVLGIFGREGVDLACYWTYPKPDSFPGAAFRLYRNYDGRGAHLGDISLPAATNNRQVMSFAARDSRTGGLDVVLVNEAGQPARVRLDLGRAVRGEVAGYEVGGNRPDVAGRQVADLASPISLAPMSALLLHLEASQIR